MRVREVEPVVGPTVGLVAFGNKIIPIEVRIASEGRADLVNVGPIDVDVAGDEEAIELEIHRERIAAYDGAVAEACADVAVGR